LKIIESPQIKLDKDPFLANMNMIELEGKKVMVRPYLVELTKGKDVIICEEKQPRMIKSKSLNASDGRGMRGTSHILIPKPLLTSS
jgi:hypothetical protein